MFAAEKQRRSPRRSLGPAAVGWAERVLLGVLMNLAATVVERRLQRAFEPAASAARAKQVGQQADDDHHPESSENRRGPGRHPG